MGRGDGPAVEPVAVRQQLAYFVERGGASFEGANIALRKDPRHVLLGRGAQPDAAATLEQELEGTRIRHQAATGRDHGAPIVRQHALERAPLEAAKRVLSVHREHFAERRTGFLLDLAVELYEGQLERLRELGSEG